MTEALVAANPGIGLAEEEKYESFRRNPEAYWTYIMMTARGKKRDPDTSPKKEEYISSTITVRYYGTIPETEIVTVDSARLWTSDGLIIYAGRTGVEQPEDEEEEQLEFLHDATINELSVNHDEAEEFHEYLMRLRRTHEVSE